MLPWDLETIVWILALLTAGACLILLVMEGLRWLRQGGNRGTFPEELPEEAIGVQALTEQRDHLAADLIRHAKHVPDHEGELVYDAMWNAMLLETASDGRIDLREIRYITSFVSQISGRSFSSDQAMEAAEDTAKNPQKAMSNVAKARNTGESSRAFILAGAFLVSLSDGELEDKEADRLGDIADALGFDLGDRKNFYREMTNRLKASA